MLYPSDISGDLIKKKKGQDIDYIRRNLLELKVFFRSFNVETVEQLRSYTLSSFVADIGGQMGLFLGASLITLSEFLEFIVTSIYTKCRPQKKIN